MRQLSGTWMRHAGDFWGGVAAMLVALPASVAFGVTVYSTISPDYASFGALAGVLGAMALGVIAPVFGGTDRLISAPCAPAAVVLSAFAVNMVHQGVDPSTIVLMMTVLGILAGSFQILIGLLGTGRLIKYLPYPVVSGYLIAIGLLIIGSQIPKFVGVPVGNSWFEALITPHHWDWRSLAIGSVTITVILFAHRIIKAVPPSIVGIFAGFLTYALIALFDPSLRVLAGNSLVIGEFGASGKGYVSLITDRWQQIGELTLLQVGSLVGSALILGALLCIDTLKTCVVLDQKTRTRHDSDRELTAQGLGNTVASIIGGMPGAGTMGATMVNLASGGKTRISGVIEGVAAVVVTLLLGSFVSWIPVATLGGVLIVVGVRMIDTDPLRFLESGSTVLDFSVVLAVVGVALTVDLVAAAIVGVLLSIMLFLREQVGGSVLRRKSYVGQRSSTWARPEQEIRVLEAKGDSAVIFELQGSLFFGTAQRLYRMLEAELDITNYMIVDMKRVQSIDITAANSLNLVRDILAERNVPLLLSHVSERLPNGRNLREFLELSGLVPDARTVFFLPTLEAAIEWVEDHLLGDTSEEDEDDLLVPALDEIELFKGGDAQTLADLEAYLEKREYRAGEKVYSLGEPNTDLYIILRGEVRIVSRVGRGLSEKHVATFGRGEFFGTLGFLDHQARANDAIATRDCEILVLTQETFNKLAQEHKRIAFVVARKLAQVLAVRLRHTDKELQLLQDDSL